tara:strand:- start:261 stop:434 length:174 start_codon:yes stop_codon:yes gene_type:complete
MLPLSLMVLLVETFQLLLLQLNLPLLLRKRKSKRLQLKLNLLKNLALKRKEELLGNI